MKIPALIAVAALMLTGCSNLPPLTKERREQCDTLPMQIAGQQARDVMSRYAVLRADRAVCAIDVGGARLLSAMMHRAEGSDPDFPIMVLLYKSDSFASVSCNWDGGTFGKAGRDAVAVNREHFGDRICRPWADQPALLP